MITDEDIHYDGFRTFIWLSDIIGIPIDQTNFVLTQFVALGLAGLLRWKLHPGSASPNVRHSYGLFFGLCLSYFCFGRKAIHIVGMPTLCYVVISTQSPKIVHKLILFLSLGYLSIIHLHRQIYEYNSYMLDVSGPLMVITQKVTSLAFNIHDGLARDKEILTTAQKHQAVKKIPTMLEYFSYVFHFQALMAGPVIFYRDYIDFIHGRHGHRVMSQNGFSNGKTSQIEDIASRISPTEAVVKKVLGSVFCAFVMVCFISKYPIQRIKDEEFWRNTTLFQKIWFLNMATMLTRFKYFHAWLFADAICNNSGLGFNGFHENGKARWDLISNVDVIKFETAPNLREAISSWNIGTNVWLRSVVYERVTRYRTICTYTLSAIWHGFYPGYYITFANGAMFTFAARAVRRHVRPYFQGSQRLKFTYDVLTIFATRVVMAYMTFSFILLELVPSINLYLHMYLILHLMGVAAILLLPLLPRAASPATAIVNNKRVSNGMAHKSE